MNEDTFRMTLLHLVPLAIAELRGLTGEERKALADKDAQLIAEKADRLMFQTPSSRSSGVLAAVARALGTLSFLPGGVTAFGVHACAVCELGEACPFGGGGVPVGPFGVVREVHVDPA
jgi:hypothetical protein